jgi:hypothetical protein
MTRAAGIPNKELIAKLCRHIPFPRQGFILRITGLKTSMGGYVFTAEQVNRTLTKRYIVKSVGQGK